MSEKRRECPRCEKRTLHSDWKVSPEGSRASTAERLLLGVFTCGISEMVMEHRRRCLVCGYTRDV